MDTVIKLFDPGECKEDYKKDGMCAASCREETKNCQIYKFSVVFGGCMFRSIPTGKCMRPDEARK